MTRRAHTKRLAILLGGALVASLAIAQAPPPVMRFELGNGVAVVRCPMPPSAWEPPQCWQPEGFTFGRYGVLRLARSFVRAPVEGPLHGRIFAAVPDNPSQLGAARMAPIVFTDDLGATWGESVWDPATGAGGLGAFTPLAIAIDRGSTRVVAVGEYARLWISADGGASFVERRRGGQTYVAVETLGRAIVITDTDGRVWSTTDDGSSLRAVTSERGASITREDDAIVVRHRSRTVRIPAR
jgi:hypothetical protein